MAANNYFGFTHGGTQYGTATASAAYGGQTGYAVAPAATAATYGTQRAAATGYDSAYQAAATQAAHAHAAAQHVAAAQSAYDVSKTAYYQQAAAAYPAPAAPQPQPAYDATAAKPAYTTPAAAYQQYGGGARAAGGAAPAAKPAYGSVYTATSAAAAVAASATYPPHSYTAPQPHAHAHTHAPKQQANRAYTNTYDTALYNAATMYVAQQTKPAAPAPAHSGWKSYNKSGGSNTNQRRPKAPPKALQLHYCDVCRISCAGPQTYREHLEGQKHKKKEAAVKLAAAGAHAASARSSAASSLRCELCDVTCTGSDAYAAHVRGIKHQKVVKLHTMLGKPIPSTEPTKLGGAVKKTVGATSKIAFVSSGGLSTVGGGGSAVKVEGEAAAAVPAVTAAATAAAAAEADTDDGADDGEPEIQPVGQDYIEEIRADDGKAISFNCKLCDCRFNDPNAKEMHMKGRRHRLQYKKKVQPDLEVKVKPSLRQRQLAEQKAQRLMVREEMWARRRMHMMEMGMEGMEEAYWGGEGGSWRGAPPHHAPYGLAPPYAHAPHGLAHAPHGVAPPPRRPDTSDDKHVMAKHADIYPAEPELHHIQRLVSHTERALKGLSDALADLARPHHNKQRAAAGPAPATRAAAATAAAPAAAAVNANKDDGKIKEEKTEGKEDGRDNQLFSFANEGENANGPSTGGASAASGGSAAGEASGPVIAGGVQGAVSSALGATAPGGRALKGVMRVGLLAKGLLLKGDRDVRLVVLCHDRPTVTLLKRVAADLPSQLNKVKGTEEVKYDVKLQPAEGAVSVTDGTYTVLVSLTSPVMREMEGGGDKRDDKDVLPRQKCLDALAALRHAKWFQARAATLQSCVMLIRIMRDVCRRCPVWAAVRPWAMELLAACVVGSAGGALSPGEALRRLMEAVASGLLLEHGPGLLDPCEKEPQDALGAITPQQREDLTASAQTFLRQIVYRQIHKVLDMELLPKPKFSNTPAWKNPRKRRRSQNETESDGKVVKTEEKMDTSAGIEAK